MNLLFALILILAASWHAEWRVHRYAGKGPGSVPSEPHPLSYFTADPFLRDDANDFCIACTVEEKATLHLKMTARTEVRSVGVLGRLEVFDVFYYFESKETPGWKFVLVKTGPDRYREIIHVQGALMGYFIGPTRLVRAGSEWILDARASAGGNKGVTYGDYFWLGEDGPVLVDLDEPVTRAGIPLLRPGKSIWGLVNVDFQAMSATLPLQDHSMWGCCSDDRIVVRFRIQKGKVAITSARYVAAP